MWTWLLVQLSDGAPINLVLPAYANGEFLIAVTEDQFLIAVTSDLFLIARVS